jgi:hypothetical protein
MSVFYSRVWCARLFEMSSDCTIKFPITVASQPSTFTSLALTAEAQCGPSQISSRNDDINPAKAECSHSVSLEFHDLTTKRVPMRLNTFVHISDAGSEPGSCRNQSTIANGDRSLIEARLTLNRRKRLMIRLAGPMKSCGMFCFLI